MAALVVTPAEAQTMLKIRRAELLRLLDIGEIPAYRDGSHWKIPVKTLEEYVITRALDEAQTRKMVEEETNE